MKLTDKKILLISPEPWDHLLVSKHHYAIHLARRGNRVFFLNPPKKKTHPLKINPTQYENLRVIDYTGFFPGLRFLPAPMQRLMIRRKFHQIEDLIDGEINVIWSFDNSVFYDFNALPDRVLKISHIVDFNQDFETDKAAETADFCFYTSRYIGEKLKKINNHSYFIHHGYAQSGKTENIGLPREGLVVKAGYAGNLDIKYIDWTILEEIIENHPEVGFYFAGTCANPDRVRWFDQASNVFYLGKLQKGLLDSFYTQMDLLLLVYQADKYPEQLANPHKIMEYMASGKSIVATYSAEYADLKPGLIYMSQRNAELPELFVQVVSSLQKDGADGLAAERKALALDNTYYRQIDRIIKIIREGNAQKLKE